MAVLRATTRGQATRGTILASAARTAAQSVDVEHALVDAAVQIHIKVTAGSGFGITPSIRGKDPVTGDYYTLLTGAKIIATGSVTLKVGRGITVAANVAASDMVPAIFNVAMAVDDATSATYSIGYSLG